MPEGCIKTWRERDTHAATGRYVAYFVELGLKPTEIWADADGLGLPMCDQLDAVKWKVNRFHRGSASPHPRYKNLASYTWHEVAQKVRRVISNSALLSLLTHASRLCAGNLARSFRLIRKVFPWATPLRKWRNNSSSGA